MGNWNAATSCLSFTMSTFITDEILPKPTVNVSQLVLFDEVFVVVFCFYENI